MITVFLQQVISGLATGCLYALAALGLVLIFKTSDVMNFAQGEMAMFSTFIAFTLMTSAGLAYWYAFIGALIFAAVFAMGIERTLIRPMNKAPLLSVLILTIGIMMVINGVAGWIWGFESTNFPTPVDGDPIRLGTLVITQPDIINLFVTVVIMAIFYAIFKYSLVGIAMRAVAENPLAARLLGVSVNKVYSITWAVGGVLGVIAGMFIAPRTYLDINMMVDMLVKSFTAAVLGGFNTLTGPVAGGLILGVLENLVAGYVSTELKSTFAFALIVVVLCIRPQGILGKVERKKV